MRIRWIVNSLLLLSGLMSGAVLADRPDSPNAHIDSGLLGQIDSVVRFCSAANPSGAKSYQAVLKQTTAGYSRDTLEDARETWAYHQGFRMMGKALDTIPPAQRVSACSQLLTLH